MVGTGFRICGSRVAESGKRPLGKSVWSHRPAHFSYVLGIRFSLEWSSPTSIRSDGKRGSDVNWRSIRNYYWFDPRTKDNKHTQSAVAPGFVIPDHIRLIDSILCL